jgi:microcystin-dependent protein
MANSGRVFERGADGVTFETPTPASQPGDTFPAGVIMAYAGAAAPTNWAICDGSAVARTGAFANLFAVIGTTYGAGDGSTTFNLPDLRGRSVVGKHSSGTFTTLGATGGEETHILTTAELAAHSHNASTGVNSNDHTHSGVTNAGGSHAHSIPNRATSNGATGYASGAFFSGQIMLNGGNSEITSTAADHAHSFSTGGVSANHTHAVTVNNAGSGNAHNNMSPYMVLNHIIKY